MRFFNSAVSTSKTGMCPNCHDVRNLRLSIERKPVLGKGGTITRTEISTVHCETCGSFVSSESRELEQEDWWE